MQARVMTDVELLHATEAAEFKEQEYDFARILRGIEEIVSGALSYSSDPSRAVECEDKDDSLDQGDDNSCEPTEKSSVSSRCNGGDASVTTCSLSDLSYATDYQSLNRHVSWFDDEENMCHEHSVEVKYIETEKNAHVKKMLPYWNKMCLNIKSARKRVKKEQ